MADSATPAANHAINLNGPTSIVSAFLPYYSPGQFYGRVIYANSRQTTYQVFCPDAPRKQGIACRDKSGARIIQGPSTYFMSHYYTEENAQHVQSELMDCDLYPKNDSLRCRVKRITSMDGIGAQTILQTFSTDGIQELMQPLTLTENLDRLYTSPTPNIRTVTVFPSKTESASLSTETDEFAPPSRTSMLGDIATVLVSPTPAGASEIESLLTDNDAQASPSTTATRVWSAVQGSEKSSAPSAVPTETGSGAGSITTKNLLVVGMALIGGVMALF